MTTSLRYGAFVLNAEETCFRLWAPSQKKVGLETADGRSFDLLSEPGGWFEAVLPLPAGTGYRYRIEQDGESLLIPDPASRRQQGDVHDASVVADPLAYVWQHEGWRGRPWHEAVIYELHVGLLGGYAGVEARLPELAALGITAIELMPINDFPGSRNWGYDGVLPYAPDTAYGTPDELRHLIDTAHGLGLMVLLDVVYNHFGPDGNYLGMLSPEFYRDDMHTPWGSSIDFRRSEVRAFFTDNALQWIIDYRFDGLRMDAVHAITEPDWLDEMALIVRARAGVGRHVHLVLENDDNVASHLDPSRYRFDAQWNDDAHHALHVLLTNESEGYYGDYADRPAEHLARILAEGFAYQGEPSANRAGAPRGTASSHLPPTAFVDCLQNHDQIGNRALGDRLIDLVDPQALQAAVALLLLSPHIPLLFMGEEVGSRTPFLFFTDHHDELADQVRQGRRNEFARFPSFADPSVRDKIPDPNHPATFEDSRPQHGPKAEEWRALYRRLLTLRRERLMPQLPGAKSLGATALGRSAVAASWQLGDQSRLILACNFGDLPVAWPEAPATEHLLFATVEGGADLPARCTRCYIVGGLPNDLRELAEGVGIAVDWVDFSGGRRTLSRQTLTALLNALGHDTDSPATLARSLAGLRAAATLPAMVTARVGERITVAIPPGESWRAVRGVLQTEAGARRELAIELGPADAVPATLAFAGLDEPGYHRLELTLGDSEKPELHTVTVAVAQTSAFAPGAQRAWGTAVQLYALRPESTRVGPDPGLGDFSALTAFARSAGKAGAQLVAISPTHAGFAADPSQFSPYSPSSRLFHNVLLIDPEALFGAEAAGVAAEAAGIAAELRAVKREDHIDWPRAGACKLRWLRALFDAKQPAPFEMPEALRLHATFEALHAHFGAEGLSHWRDWPAAYRDPASTDVAAFAEAHAQEIRFHAWLQGSAVRGLQQAQQAAVDAGMKIGLIADVAIGMTGSGSHAWASRSDLLVGLEIGAPPDLLNTRGQSWGLTAFSPLALAQSGFAPFIATLRAAMRHAGGVRIDHVLGLNRLWLVPEGMSAADGAFLHYPLRDLLNLLILESHRHRAIVIGEDLGTVPEGFRATLADAGILGMRVLWLERTADGNGFIPPETWSADAVAMTTTHDLPTAAGWWQGRDLHWRERIGADGDPFTAQRLRIEAKAALRLLASRRHDDDDDDGVELAIEVVARSPGALVVIPIEDLIGLIEQPNLPGTIHEHPNWRQRLPSSADRLLTEGPAPARTALLRRLRPSRAG